MYNTFNSLVVAPLPDGDWKKNKDHIMYFLANIQIIIPVNQQIVIGNINIQFVTFIFFGRVRKNIRLNILKIRNQSIQ